MVDPIQTGSDRRTGAHHRRCTGADGDGGIRLGRPLAPAFAYVDKHPKTPFSLLADAGRGHFDFSDAMVRYLGLYIRKAAQYRLPNPSNQSIQSY
ncbi:hypothetical protein [Spirosoma telluris]|uniref:hypothetical protein n=1 Tax=Spirosoma telluris TaxID=2183553 RepID=UPI0018DE0AEA